MEKPRPYGRGYFMTGPWGLPEHYFPLRNSFRDIIQRFLDDFEHILLDQAGFVADADYQVTFCHRPSPGWLF